MKPGSFFTEAQLRRLQALMQRLQEAGSAPEAALTPEERAELNALIEAELPASAQRASALADAHER